jgi:hypothetical protein
MYLLCHGKSAFSVAIEQSVSNILVKKRMDFEASLVMGMKQIFEVDEKTFMSVLNLSTSLQLKGGGGRAEYSSSSPSPQHHHPTTQCISVVISYKDDAANILLLWSSS